jgi:uncharacterized protein YjbI with pentapeptide repeats
LPVVLNGNDIAVRSLTAEKIDVRELSAISAYLGNVTIDSRGAVKGGQTAYNTGIGFFQGYSGGTYKISIGDPAGNGLTWDGSVLTITGVLIVTVGSTIAGFDIGSDYIRDVANSFGLASTVTGGDDIRFWAGSTFADRATAPLRLYESGAISGSNVTITGGSVAGSTITLASITGSQIQSATITGTNIASGTITGTNIASGTITATNIVNATITGTQIALATITGGNIASATITGSNIAAATIAAGNIISATITGTQIAAATITGTNIAAATIAGSNIASATIAAGNIVSGTITTTQIAAGTIVGSNIASATITGANIAGTTITATNITALTITAAEIANLTINGTKISAGAISADKTNVPVFIQSAGTFTNNSPGAGSVAWLGVQVAYNGTIYTLTDGNTANKYLIWDSTSPTTLTTSSSVPTATTSWLIGMNLAGTYTKTWDLPQVHGEQIEAATITGTQIASATITATNITAATITAVQIANGTITGTQIAAATIAGSNIASGTITSTNIQDASITGADIASATIAAGNIANATITTTQISATAGIVGGQIANNTITATNIVNATITGTQIATGTITATNITALTITAAEIANLTITSGKIADVSIDKLTSGTITSKTVTLAISEGTGDVYFNAGKTDFTNVQSGFILGLDDSDSNKAKFYIGDANYYFNWTGTGLEMKATNSNLQLYQTTVDAAGHGDYTTLGAAITAGKTNIYIRRGDYSGAHEDITLSSETTIIGEDKDNTILDVSFTIAGSSITTQNTVTATNNSTTITGSSTTWSGTVLAGDYLIIDSQYYHVVSVDTNTQITLVEKFFGTGGAGLSYRVIRPVKNIYFNSFKIVNTSARAIVLNYTDNVVIEGMKFNPTFTVSDAHIYSANGYNYNFKFQTNNVEYATGGFISFNGYYFSIDRNIFNHTGYGTLNSGTLYCVNIGTSSSFGSIQDNTVSPFFNNGTGGANTIAIYSDGTYITIRNNKVDGGNKTSVGIYIDSNGAYNSVIGNEVIRCFADGIYIVGDNTNIVGNSLTLNDYGLYINASADRTNYSGNKIYGNTTADISNNGSNSEAGVSSSDIQNMTYSYAADAGATDDYAITLSSAPSAYAMGQMFLFKANTANTGGATLNVNSLGALPIFKKATTVLANNDILANMLVLVSTYQESAGATLQSYSGTGGGNAGLNNTTWGVSQTFAGKNAKFTSCKWNINKASTPTGNAVAKIYAISGTPGTNAIPTGTALATSDNFDVSTLTTSYVLTTFTFSGANIIRLSEGTTYALTIEYSGGSASNVVTPEGSSGDLYSGQNSATMNTSGGWTALNATYDQAFAVVGQVQYFQMLSQIAN